MRNALILLFIGVLQAHAIDTYSQNTKLSLNFSDAELVSVLDKIENESEFFFLYNEKLLDISRKVSITAEAQLINVILDNLFAGTDVKYTIIDRKIILAPDYLTSESQQKQITGTVTDKNGAPVIGANVVVTGTTLGTMTDIDGKYSIEVPQGSKSLTISFIGMEPQIISIGTLTQINVTMFESTTGLDEVVVIGYGTARKSDITGSVSSVTTDNIASVPVTDLRQALQGRAAGVDVLYGNRSPGEGAAVVIRGRRSFKASNDPLYVIDGIPTSNAQLGDINPNDIESMEILKDASATAIYGSRAANGVVLIQTKRGKAGRTIVTYDGDVRVAVVDKMLDMENGGQYAEQRREAFRNSSMKIYKSAYADPYYDWFGPDGIFQHDPVLWESVAMGYEWEDAAKTIVKRDANGIPIYDPNKVRSTDWTSLIFRKAMAGNHRLSISGGTEKMKVLFAATTYYEEGIILGQDFKRHVLRLNLDQEITKWFNLRVSTNYSFSNQNVGSNLYSETLFQIPLALPYDENGNVVIRPGNDSMLYTPLNNIDGVLNERKRSRFFAAITAEIKPFEGLTYLMNFGPDFGHYRRGIFQAGNTSPRQGGDALANYFQELNSNYVLENILTYNKSFAGMHDLTVTLMQSIQEDRLENSDVTVSALPYESQKWYNISTASKINAYSSRYSLQHLASFMGRINYSYNDKYLITITGRQDGASMLAEGNKYEFFPAVALAWKIDKENFMQNIKFLSDLKLRGGYGIIGNSSISPYQTQGDLARTTYEWHGNAAYGYEGNTIPNPDLKWETTSSTNVGVDFSFFERRISGSIDAYRSNTTNLLMDMQLPAVNGFRAMIANVGSTRNSGLEIQLSGIIVNTDAGFKWSTEVTWYKNKEEITELYGGEKDDIGNKLFIGQPIRTFYDYKWQGIWQDTPQDSVLMQQFNSTGSNFEPGKIRIADLNGDKTINVEDRMVLGSDVPDWTGSWQNTFTYKGIELSLLFYSRQGQMFSAVELSNRLELFGRFPGLIVYYWKPTDPDRANAKYPRPKFEQEHPEFWEVFRYVDGSFTKLRNVTMAYTFPQTIVSKLRIQNLRVYVNARNPITWTTYKGLDPEKVGAGTAIAAASWGQEAQVGVQEDSPSSKVFTFGLNLTF